MVSRSPERAEEAARLAGAARPGSLGDVAGVEVVVNASPVGMEGGADPDGIPVLAASLDASQVVVDIVYQPLQTPLLSAAGRVGATTVNGVGMLVHQAALQFERWTGQPAPIGAMTSSVADLISA